jgi:hypothetical protein
MAASKEARLANLNTAMVASGLIGVPTSLASTARTLTDSVTGTV